jgi:hypothetical protein
MQDSDKLDQFHGIDDRIAFGRPSADKAESAIMRLDLGVTWRKGVTRAELTEAVSQACDNLLIDLAGAPDEVFTTDEDAHS